MNETDKTRSVRSLKGIVKKPGVPVSVDDMNEAIKLEACAGSTDDRAAASGHAPSSVPRAHQS